MFVVAGSGEVQEEEGDKDDEELQSSVSSESEESGDSPGPAWLKEFENSGKIKLEQGEFQYVTKGDFTRTKCYNAHGDQSIGECRLIADCPEMHSVLTDINFYSKHFCTLMGK